LVANCFAVVVFPTHGVPVIRMTRFIWLCWVGVVVIGFGFLPIEKLI
jgi:hypothetical protein